MPESKNILIFADGTGQAGGLKPDQCLSNIYKLYRATRNGPDSNIDPVKQLAFYDAGLGSDEVAGPLASRIITTVRKFLSSAFGTGFTTNVADCYAAILSVYNPGDRIFLFGFSRGAYTVRSVAGVMNLCGVPVKDANGNPIPRWGRALREIADEAVHTVYEHGAGKPRGEYEEEREEQARRFREKYQTQDDPKTNLRGNVVPYFIGVFDTVAALGSSGIKKAMMIFVSIGATAAFIGITAKVLSWIFGWSFLVTGSVVAAVFAGWLVFYNVKARVRFIRNFPKPGDWSWHWSAWRFQHYDKFLDKRVRYARHAQAIDEKRTTFERVGWGKWSDVKDMPNDWLVQRWFAGNHSDIGGSYPETESRLSDIALKWMAKEAEGVPNGMLVDWTKLNVFGDPLAMQHCEIEMLRERYPKWWPEPFRLSWNEGVRKDAKDAADFDESVEKRFNAEAILNCGRVMKYRPECLRENHRFKAFYPEEKKVASTLGGEGKTE